MKTLDELVRDLSKRITEYVDACDASAIYDLGVLCYGENDEDVKALGMAIEVTNFIVADTLPGYIPAKGPGDISFHDCVIDATYQELLIILGRQHSNGDEYKSSTEWEFSPLNKPGIFLTVYDYKLDKSYDSSGVDVRRCGKRIQWHIGGNNPKEEKKFETALNHKLKEIRKND
jgi:hypothetical protein